jgi:prepilin peptidase CpaA
MLVTTAILVRCMAIAILLRIAWRDMEIQKIGNGDVIALGIVGLVLLGLDGYASGSWTPLLFGVGLAAALFAALIPFWIWRKLGAGDVKLMAVVPLVAGSQNMLPFSLILLVTTLITVFLVKNPMLLPAPMFQKYLKIYDRKGVVPFGVPIAISLIGILVLRIIGR